MRKSKKVVKSIQAIVLSIVMVVTEFGGFVPNVKVQADSKDVTDDVITPWVVYSAGQMGRSESWDGWSTRYFKSFTTTAGEKKSDWDSNFKYQQHVDSGEETWQTQKTSKGYTADIACTGYDFVWNENEDKIDDNPYMLNANMKSIKLQRGHNYSILMDFSWIMTTSIVGVKAPEKNIRIDVKDSESNNLCLRNICVGTGKSYHFNSGKTNNNVYEINTKESDVIEITIAMGAFTYSYDKGYTLEEPNAAGILSMSNFKIIDEGEIPGYDKNTYKGSSASNNIDFKLGSTPELKIPSDMPIIGGGKLGLDFGNVPVQFNREGNNFKIGIGVKDLVDFDKNGWTTFKKFVDTQKESYRKGINNLLETRSGVASMGLSVKPKISCYGYLEGTITDKGIQSAGGKLAIEISAKASKDWQTIVVVVPVVIKASVEVSWSGFFKAKCIF